MNREKMVDDIVFGKVRGQENNYRREIDSEKD